VVTANFNSTTFGANYRAIVVHEFSGLGTSDPYDSGSHNGGSGTGTSLDSGNIAISGSSDVIVALFESDGATITTPGTYSLTTFNASGDANNYFADGYHIVTASEHATATATSAAWYAVAAAFKAPGGGGASFPAAILMNPLRGCCR
jgi:hypothetical protein